MSTRRIVILDRATARRAHELGGVGEALAARILSAAGFTQIRNLNDAKRNFPFGDIYAERGTERYVISVKARNRHEARTGRLNSRYNLGRRCHELAREAESQLRATAAFLAISLSDDFYSAYFAPLSVLASSRGIPMTSTAVTRYTCLAVDVPHGLALEHLKNTYDERSLTPSNGA